MEHIIREILFITNNPEFKHHLRFLLAEYTQFSYVIAHSIKQSLAYIKDNNFRLILLDEKIFFDSREESILLIKEISSLCLALKTILIVETLKEEIIVKYMKEGFSYIADIRSTKVLLPALLKYLGESSLEISPTTVRYKNIILCSENNILMINQCKIFLTFNDTNIIKYLISKKTFVSGDTLREYLEHIYEKNITKTYITVSISRINQKTRNATGLKLIKNRYGLGYYISI